MMHETALGNLTAGGESASGPSPHAGVRLSFNCKSLTASAKNSDGEETSSECDFETVQGEPKEFGISLGYMLWAVESLSPEENIEIAYSADGGPILITAHGIEDMRRVVTPRRI